MVYILNIETSTKNCSVSIAENGKLISLRELNSGGYSHAEKLHPFIQDCMSEAKLTFQQVDAIAIGKGPGSYTGLRIGVSAAKGLCFANDIPLISINSLEVLANSSQVESGVIIPLIDARRMEVYSAIFGINYTLIRETQAEIIDESSFLPYLEKGKVHFLGDGAEKCKETLVHKNACFIDGKFPSAESMSHLSFDKFQNNDFENVAYFEPFYLKDFVVTPQKRKS